MWKKFFPSAFNKKIQTNKIISFEKSLFYNLKMYWSSYMNKIFMKEGNQNDFHFALQLSVNKTHVFHTQDLTGFIKQSKRESIVQPFINHKTRFFRAHPSAGSNRKYQSVFTNHYSAMCQFQKLTSLCSAIDLWYFLWWMPGTATSRVMAVMTINGCLISFIKKLRSC